VFGFDGTHWDPVDTDLWQKWISKNKLGMKVFKQGEEDLEDEVKVSAPIVKILGSEYTTLAPYDQKYIGFQLDLNNDSVATINGNVYNKDARQTLPAVIQDSSLFVIPAISCVSDLDVYTLRDSSEYDTVFEHLYKALQTLHAKQYFHMDIKPENVVMCPLSDPPVKLIDFGLSTGIQNIDPSFLGGTDRYVSPILASWVGNAKVLKDVYRNNQIVAMYNFNHEEAEMLYGLIDHHIESFKKYFAAMTRQAFDRNAMAQAYDDDASYIVLVPAIYKSADMYAAALTMIIMWAHSAVVRANVSLGEVIGKLQRWVEFPRVKTMTSRR
jgi:hypothetical protein